QQIAGEAFAALGRIDRDREDFGLVGCHPRDGKTDDLSSKPQAMRERVALGEHAFEFAFAPAAMEGGGVKLCKLRRIAEAGGFDDRLAAAKELGEPGHADAEEPTPCDGLASGARR